LDNILPAYNDPLFSILIIVILVLIVTVTSVLLGNYKERNRKESLKKFLGEFDKSSCVLAIEEMPFEKALIEPLTLLAEEKVEVDAEELVGVFCKACRTDVPFKLETDLFWDECLPEEFGLDDDASSLCHRLSPLEGGLTFLYS